jgi:SPX domain protein involved in polyphosphate accumulation
MTFLHYLETESIPEWSSQYVDYRKLDEILKEIAEEMTRCAVQERRKSFVPSKALSSWQTRYSGQEVESDLVNASSMHYWQEYMHRCGRYLGTARKYALYGGTPVSYDAVR